MCRLGAVLYTVWMSPNRGAMEYLHTRGRHGALRYPFDRVIKYLIKRIAQCAAMCATVCGALIRTRRFATFARLQCTHCSSSRVHCSSLHRAGACDRARGIQQRRDPADGGDCTSCTRLVKWTPRVPASPALPALPHTQYTHTQSHNRRHGSRLGAGRRGWDAAEQRSSGAEGDWRRRPVEG